MQALHLPPSPLQPCMSHPHLIEKHDPGHCASPGLRVACLEGQCHIALEEAARQLCIHWGQVLQEKG